MYRSSRATSIRIDQTDVDKIRPSIGCRELSAVSTWRNLLQRKWRERSVWAHNLCIGSHEIHKARVASKGFQFDRRLFAIHCGLERDIRWRGWTHQPANSSLPHPLETTPCWPSSTPSTAQITCKYSRFSKSIIPICKDGVVPFGCLIENWNLRQPLARNCQNISLHHRNRDKPFKRSTNRRADNRLKISFDNQVSRNNRRLFDKNLRKQFRIRHIIKISSSVFGGIFHTREMFGSSMTSKHDRGDCDLRRLISIEQCLRWRSRIAIRNYDRMLLTRFHFDESIQTDCHRCLKVWHITDRHRSCSSNRSRFISSNLHRKIPSCTIYAANSSKSKDNNSNIIKS